VVVLCCAIGIGGVEGSSLLTSSLLLWMPQAASDWTVIVLRRAYFPSSLSQGLTQAPTSMNYTAFYYLKTLLYKVLVNVALIYS
jgi:hypothetical protein